MNLVTADSSKFIYDGIVKSSTVFFCDEVRHKKIKKRESTSLQIHRIGVL